MTALTRKKTPSDTNKERSFHWHVESTELDFMSSPSGGKVVEGCDCCCCLCTPTDPLPDPVNGSHSGSK